MTAPQAAATGTAAKKSEPGRDAVAREQERSDIGAEPDIERVPERQLPGKAHHDVPGLPGIGEIENENEDGEQIIADEKRRGEKRNAERGQQQ